MTPLKLLYSGTRTLPGRRVLAGERILTPVKPLELGVRGRGEKLLPGRDRLSRDHWAVRERPEWFRPADPKDVDTARDHSVRLGRAAPSNPPATWTDGDDHGNDVPAARKRPARELAPSMTSIGSDPMGRLALGGLHSGLLSPRLRVAPRTGGRGVSP